MNERAGADPNAARHAARWLVVAAFAAAAALLVVAASRAIHRAPTGRPEKAQGASR